MCSFFHGYTLYLKYILTIKPDCALTDLGKSVKEYLKYSTKSISIAKKRYIYPSQTIIYCMKLRKKDVNN